MIVSRRILTCLATALVTGTLIAGCDSLMGPTVKRVEVNPSDTSVVAGMTYPLRVRVFDEDGKELSRDAYSLSYTTSSQLVATVASGDTVRTTDGGTANIGVTASTSRGQATTTIVVRVGVIVRNMR